MRYLFISVSLLFALQTTALAQSVCQVIETPKLLIKNWQHSYTIDFTNTTATTLTAAWSAKMKEAGAMKIETTTDAIGFKNVLLPMISSQPMQVFIRTYTDADEVLYLTVWFREGSQFLSSRSRPQTKESVHKYLERFASDMVATSNKKPVNSSPRL